MPDAGGDPRSNAEATKSDRFVLAKLICGLVEDAEYLSDQLIEYHGNIASVFANCVLGGLHSGLIPEHISTYLRDVANLLGGSYQRNSIKGCRISSPSSLTDILRREMVSLERENFRVLFLDGENFTLSDQTMWTGTVNAVQVHPREIVREAIDVGATAVILAHNHPSSSARPSGEDIRLTTKVFEACQSVDVLVHDHVIVARDGVFSMRAAGIIARIAEEHRTYQNAQLGNVA